MKCAHHWVIDAASGLVSQGTCKVCGEVREFRNSADTSGKIWRKQGSEKPAKPRNWTAST